MRRAALVLGFGSAVAILFSIAASQILLVLALVALLVSDARLRLPPIWRALALFLLATLLSLAFSPDPAAGLPQVRKIFVYSALLVAFSLFRDLDIVRRVFLCWAGGGALVATRGLIQFVDKMAEARRLGLHFYEYYVPARITGFQSHWMTFGGQEMYALLVLAAFLFFSPSARKRTWFWLLCAAVMSTALVLGMTRGICIATAAAGLYLAWFWKRWVVAVAPVAAALVLLVAPVRERVTSLVRPQSEVDSNQHRLITWRTGLRMIRAHPLLGLGPEEVKVQFMNWVPTDVPRPLPSGWYGHLHNIYLQYAAERGIPAMLALVWMLLQMLYDFRRAVRRLPPGRDDRRFVLHAAIAVTAATMISGMSEHNLGDSEVLTMFLIVAACGYVAVEAERESARP